MEITKVKDRDLLNMYINAMYTYAMAGGHTKAEMNKLKADEYKAEMDKRYMSIPNWDAINGHGTFNGKGAV